MRNRCRWPRYFRAMFNSLVENNARHLAEQTVQHREEIDHQILGQRGPISDSIDDMP